MSCQDIFCNPDLQKTSQWKRKMLWKKLQGING